jgi:hypothetical protein
VAAIPFPLAGEGASTLSVETDVKLVLQVFVAAAWLATSGIVPAASPEEFVKLYAEQAKLADPAFAGFSAERGRELYMKQHPVEGNGMLSCASCHHADPTKATQAHVDQIPCRACHILFSGQPESHRPTRREIPPFAPAVNPYRFTNEWKVEHWFDFNCRLLLKRACTPVEKGDLITWLLTVK